MLKIAWHKYYKHSLRENHRFPMIKYELIPQQLIRENICTAENFFTPKEAIEELILDTHDSDYYKIILEKKQQIRLTNIENHDYVM